MAELVEPVKFVSPPYTAVMVWLPAVSVDVVKVAVPLLTVPVPRMVAPSLKVTVPVAPAVNVTEVPKVDGVPDVVMLTVDEV